ncbi:hypothetical protein DYBT9275_03186 [Dyadobacter sp. CECT 9275]|uniref:Uncharacterized protein n=1 Tax=Dyadobacter helix TaxID=2822344 RepID=A0A916N554_9BACT|nr:hypothetical protein DYBT9275_03186 [Dyadobacter sp. CECT 9275]
MFWLSKNMGMDSKETVMRNAKAILTKPKRKPGNVITGTTLFPTTASTVSGSKGMNLSPFFGHP